MKKQKRVIAQQGRILATRRRTSSQRTRCSIPHKFQKQVNDRPLTDTSNKDQTSHAVLKYILNLKQLNI